MTSIALATARLFAERAAALRAEAAAMSTTTTDQAGRTVPIVSPEARVKLRTAALFDEVEADLNASPARA